MLLLIALWVASVSPAIPDRPATESEQRRAKTAFDAIAYDGPSARWRFEFVKRNDLVCGYVNSKNQLGAYAGWTPFAFGLKDGVFQTYGGDRRWLFDLLCHDKPAGPS